MIVLERIGKLPYSYHISRKRFMQLFPNKSPRRLDVIFKKRTKTAVVEPYIADLLIKEGVAKDINERIVNLKRELKNLLEDETINNTERWVKLKELATKCGIILKHKSKSMLIDEINDL